MATTVNNALCCTEASREQNRTVMAFSNIEYFDQIGNIQKILHESERRRHELEETLFSYLRSDERLTKLKCAKMRCYHKELHEREQRAKTRNLELLGNVENLASKLKEFSIDCSRLLQKRTEYKNHITRLKKDRKKMESRGESEADEHPSRLSTQGLSQSAAIFMGHQTSNGSSRNDGVTATHSLSHTEQIPNHLSLPPPQSGLCMHSHVSKASGAAILSDDILNSGDFLEGRRLSDVREKQMESDWDISQRARELQRREELKSPHTTLKEAEVSSRSVTVNKPADIVSLERCPTRSPSPDTTDPRDASQYMNSGGEDEEGSAEDEDDSRPRHQNRPDYTNNILKPDTSMHSDSDDSASLSQSGHRTSRGNALIQEQNIKAMQTHCGSKHKKVSTRQSGQLHFSESPYRLSVEGFCHLLKSIEQRLESEDVNLYRIPVNEQNLSDDIIRICGQRGHLDDVDLHACSAVVLQQLPMLSCSLPHGCLLPSDLINSHWSTISKPQQIRLCLSAESAVLWDCCFRHMVQLQKLLSTDHILQLFTPLLVPANATYTDKAGKLLKRLLTYKSETHHLSESESSSSCSLPSLLDDSVEIKPTIPSGTNALTSEKQEIQSAEEDSADQSPVESIPIRGKKADRRSARSGVLLCLFCLSPHAVDNGAPLFFPTGEL
ncbi:centrosomal protein kizuna isoform X2 [Danio aesculapii]|uniref:centrosomal protein kizuna isoform X2 n=1 Tax=Danio aesculapii TaxID=1142201 RepID=UPI0024C02CD8|nr:centrosomal protein kizuna isoform X2 [Danio aesculapii]